MKRRWLLLALLPTAASALGPFHDVPSGPRALPGDTLPPFGMKDEQGHVPGPPPLPPGATMPGPGGPPESTAPGPSLEQATRLANAAIADCAAAGYRVGAAVVNSAGEAVVLLNAPGSDGSHGFVGMRKALVALTFARPSSEVPALTGDPAALARITPAMFVEGGALPIRREGRIIGAIGVSGAAGTPIGHRDELCAQAALTRR
jgi:uncharacterized protein GlcG (DUF336 family)